MTSRARHWWGGEILNIAMLSPGHLDGTDILTYGYLDGGMVVVDESLAGRKKGQRQRRR